MVIDIGIRERIFEGKAIDRLAAYEDTGLTPDEVVELKGLLESAVEELENAYQRETELTERIREMI